ncbi:MAG: hypothetical protein Q9166_007401 [cf. Caloplaca sp. 2 TL-2023]
MIRTLCNAWAEEKRPCSSAVVAKPARVHLTESVSPNPVRLQLEERTSPKFFTSPPVPADVSAALSPYIDSVLGHPRIASVSQSDLSTLRLTLITFLNSHIDQLLTKLSFCSADSNTDHSFTNWLHKIAAPSVSAPFSFAFLSCLIGGLPTPTSRYIGADFANRIALMSRMYNDLGSAARDRAEGNVNCADFAALSDGQVPRDERKAKECLEGLASYEREAAQWVGTRLMDALERCWGKESRRKADAVKLFLNVAELYADVYVVKDLSNRLEPEAHLN